MQIEHVTAAQMPQMCELGDPNEPRAVGISVGAETCYAEALGFSKSASILLSVYVEGQCRLELSLPLEEAQKLSGLLAERTSQASKL